MSVSEKGVEPREGMRLWYGREVELFQTGSPGANDYARYAPVEARDEVRRLALEERMPWLIESHFALWEALLEVMGWDIFEKPIGLPPEEAARRIIGQPMLIKKGQPE